MQKKPLGRIVITVNRKNKHFNKYVDLVCNIALSKGAILNITEFRTNIDIIKITTESGNIKEVYAHFDNKAIPEAVINPCNSDIRIIRGKGQKA